MGTTQQKNQFEATMNIFGTGSEPVAVPEPAQEPEKPTPKPEAPVEESIGGLIQEAEVVTRPPQEDLGQTANFAAKKSPSKLEAIKQMIEECDDKDALQELMRERKRIRDDMRKGKEEDVGDL
jgi:hypothetical protein